MTKTTHNTEQKFKIIKCMWINHPLLWINHQLLWISHQLMWINHQLSITSTLFYIKTSFRLKRLLNDGFFKQKLLRGQILWYEDIDINYSNISLHHHKRILVWVVHTRCWCLKVYFSLKGVLFIWLKHQLEHVLWTIKTIKLRFGF